MEPIKAAKEVVSITGELIKAAGDHPDVKQAGGELAKAALTVSKAINVCLLPIAAVNYAYDKAKDYFERDFPREMGERLERIPQDKMTPPKASIAGPVIQGIAYSVEERELREMYLNLLATSMDGRKPGKAHPAYAEVIKQLNAEEGGTLKWILSQSTGHAIVEYRLTNKPGGTWLTLLRHVMDLSDPSAPNERKEHREFPAVVDNWIRLGLVTVDYTAHLLTNHRDTDLYAWATQRPEYKRLAAIQMSDEQKLDCVPGILQRTAFGASFAQAVGLIEQTD